MCDLHSVAQVLGKMIDDKVAFLWSVGEIFDARAFTALKPWLMRGLPTTPNDDEQDGGGETKERSCSGGPGGDDCGDCTSGGGSKSDLDVARELFRWRDDATEAVETKRSGAGLLFWCALNDSVGAVRELAEEAAARSLQDDGGRGGGRRGNESNNALRVHRPGEKKGRTTSIRHTRVTETYSFEYRDIFEYRGILEYRGTDDRDSVEQREVHTRDR